MKKITISILLIIGIASTNVFAQKVKTLPNKTAKPVKATVTPIASPIDTLSENTVNAVLWQQKSGEYKALCFQAFALAKIRLLEKIALHTKDGMPLAIITDIDETVLDNSPNQASDILHHRTYIDSNWKKWTTKSSAASLPGSVAFFQYADKMGIQCFYITNRSSAERDVTIKNLISAGFPQADTIHVLTKDSTSDKEPRRLKIKSTYSIALLLGDNLNDFDNMFYHQNADRRGSLVKDNSDLFGDIFIVLPNAMYGDWESAIWDGKKATNEEIKKLKHDALIQY